MSEEFEGAEAEPVAGVEAAQDEHDEQAAAPSGKSSERTGNHTVDRVLDSLDEITDQPVDEHVAVFERAHEQLRGALDGPRLPRP